MSDYRTVVIADKLIIRLRIADAQMNYTPELLRACLVSVVQASAGVQIPNCKIATAQNMAEVAYFAGLRDFPLDLLAEEFKKHLLEAKKSVKHQLRAQQLAGIMTIRLSTALSVLEAQS